MSLIEHCSKSGIQTPRSSDLEFIFCFMVKLIRNESANIKKTDYQPQDQKGKLATVKRCQSEAILGCFKADNFVITKGITIKFGKIPFMQRHQFIQ